MAEVAEIKAVPDAAAVERLEVAAVEREDLGHMSLAECPRHQFAAVDVLLLCH